MPEWPRNDNLRDKMSLFKRFLSFAESTLAGITAILWRPREDAWARAVAAEDGEALALLGKE